MTEAESWLHSSEVRLEDAYAFSPDSPLSELAVPRQAPGDSPNPVVSWGERDPVTNAVSVSVAAAWTNRGSVSSCLSPPGSSAMVVSKTLGLPKRRRFHKASVKPPLSPVAASRDGSTTSTPMTSPEQDTRRRSVQVASPLQFCFSPDRPEVHNARKAAPPSAPDREFHVPEVPLQASVMMSSRLTADGPVTHARTQRRPAPTESVAAPLSPRSLTRRSVTWKEAPVVPTSASRRVEMFATTGKTGAAVSPWTCFVEGVHRLIGCGFGP